jgi:hypothetical protein
MSITARNPTRQPGPTATPAGGRFGAATLGHPGPSSPASTGPGAPDDAQAWWPRAAPLLVAVVASVLVWVFLFGSWFADRGEVVVWQVIHPMPAGKAVTAADLRRAAVAGAAAQRAVPATANPDGWVARVPIPAAALLTPEVLTREPAMPSHGEALVGVTLGPGAAPAEGLSTGDLVRVVRIPVTDQEAAIRPGGRVVRAAAPVWAARTGKDGATTVTLRVPILYADLIAGLSARGAIALERVAGSG